MNITVLFYTLRTIYNNFLREVLIKAIDDPDSEVDDLVIAVLDILFKFNTLKEK